MIFRAPPSSPIDYWASYRLVGYDTLGVLQNATLIDKAPVLARLAADDIRVDYNGDPRVVQYIPTEQGGQYLSDFGADEKEFVRLGHGGGEYSIHQLYRNAATDPGGDTAVLNMIALDPGHPYFVQRQTDYSAGMLLDTVPGFLAVAAGVNMQAALVLDLVTAGQLTMQFDGYSWLSIMTPPSWPVGLVGTEIRFTGWTYDDVRGIFRGTNELFVRFHRN